MSETPEMVERAAEGWQPIETARKTGRTVWLGREISGAITPAWWVDGFGWATDHHEHRDPEFEGVPFEPTHWHQYYPSLPIRGTE